MPQRTARVTINNTSSYLRLVKTTDHLCGGDWTPGGWQPPATIEPGTSAGMQSESSGDIPIIGNIMTGTEGYAKYDVIGPDKRHGMIYVYWDNPWFGFTHPRFETNADDVAPDCDYSTPAAASSFSEDQSLDFSLVPIVYRHTEGGQDITSPGDLAAAFAAGPILGVFSLFGFEGIVKDPEWVFELRDVAPSFAPTQPTSRKLMTDAQPEDWVGDWRANGIDVLIDRHGQNELTAAISLNSTDSPISVNFTIGPESALFGPINDASTSSAASASPPHDSIIRESARRLLAEAPVPTNRSLISSRFQSIAAEVAQEQQIAEPMAPHRSERIGQTIGQILSDSLSTVHVGGFVLSLYGIYDGASRVSKVLHLQRVVDGTPNVDAMLPEHYEIR